MTVAMLATGGLFTGGVVWYAWERIWIWRRLELSAYAVDFRRSLRKADPALPILLVICATATAGFAWQTSGAARTLAATGIGVLAVILVSSIVLAEPINNEFRRRPKASSHRTPSACAESGDASTLSGRPWPSPRSHS
jgi:hypothetical protein